MSNALALAAVTAVIMDLLQNALIDHNLAASVGEVRVSALPPDRIIPNQQGNVNNQLNLFLYKVTPNPGWRNAGLPSRSSDVGDRLTNPPLALDLHYLLTAYGRNDLDAEILLGYGMQLLHETPGLSREAIRNSLAPPSPVSGTILPPAFQALSAADLADQVEQIKITPEYHDNEEMSRIWSAFSTNYRPSTGYLASVVLIESRRPTRVSLPVRSFNIYAEPLSQPVIERVESAVGPSQPVLPTQPLVIYGQRLRGQLTSVLVGDQEITPTPSDLSNTRIQLDIPPALHVGVQGVQVVHQRLISDPPTPHRGVESNVAAFVLHPVIQTDPVTGDYEIALLNRTVVNGLVRGTVNVDVLPSVGRDQRVSLLLNLLENPASSRAPAYNFPAALWPDPNLDEISQVSFPINGVVPGNYLVRVLVDGADSPLEVSAGAYSAPLETI
jgi:hypothetical protein